MSLPLEGTQSAANAIARVHYTHDAMVDLVIGRPGITQNEIGRYFGYTVAWVSRVFNSDAFQARLAERKTDLIDPMLIQSFEDRLKGLANQSITVLEDKLAATNSPDLAIKALELTTRALGFGARQQNVVTQNTFVVALPQKSASETQWAESARPGLILENQAGV